MDKIIDVLKGFEKVKSNLFIQINDSKQADLVENTAKRFTSKWVEVDKKVQIENIINHIRQRFLRLYGFNSELDFANFLSDKSLIFDAGCGLGYTSSWVAQLNPRSTVIAMDISDSVLIAAEKHKNISNLFFIKGDISETMFPSDYFDLVICDQVLHHTIDPYKTLKELARITKNNGYVFTYVYYKKAIPRELLDEYFRKRSLELSDQQLMELAEQLTLLGKILSKLNIIVDLPDIPLLDIKGGRWNLQRWIYYNFIKCYWNEKMGWEYSVLCNYDWYSPSIAYRYTEEEFKKMIDESGLKIDFFYQEEMASLSSRLKKLK